MATMTHRVPIGNIKGEAGTKLYKHVIQIIASNSSGSNAFITYIKTPILEPLTMDNALADTHKDIIANELARGNVLGAFSGGFYDDGENIVFDFDGVKLSDGRMIYSEEFVVTEIVDTVEEL